MKIKSGFLLREIAGTQVVVPIGERVIDFKGMMVLNDIGQVVWNKLQNECTFEDILSSVLDEYDVDTDQATADIKEFLAHIRENGALDE